MVHFKRVVFKPMFWEHWYGNICQIVILNILICLVCVSLIIIFIICFFSDTVSELAKLFQESKCT